LARISSTVSSGVRFVVTSQRPMRGVAHEAVVELFDSPGSVTPVLALSFARSQGLHRGKENDDVAGATTDHRPKVA
jgi:hypothetical protein